MVVSTIVGCCGSKVGKRLTEPAHVTLAILKQIGKYDAKAGVLCVFRSTQGRYDDALPLYEKALCLCERVSGRDHPDVAHVLKNMGGLFRVQVWPLR